MRVLIVTDAQVAKFHLAEVVERMKDDVKASTLILPASEAAKSTSGLKMIIDRLAGEKFTRNDMIIALGGGSISDVSGFAAAIYRRGMNFAIIPTTLLAMVDAAIGGKNGINYGSKNSIGTVRMPDSVDFDFKYLETLDEREWRCGYGEIIKYAVLEKEIYEKFLAINNPFQVTPELKETIEACIEYKKRIVAEDPEDMGIRHLLNLGHTAGHGIEKGSVYHISHGEAVAMGTVLEAEVSRKLGLCSRETVAEIRRMAEQVCGDARYPGYIDISDDKKARDGYIDFVGIREIGKCSIETLPINKFSEVLND